MDGGREGEEAGGKEEWSVTRRQEATCHQHRRGEVEREERGGRKGGEERGQGVHSSPPHHRLLWQRCLQGSLGGSEGQGSMSSETGTQGTFGSMQTFRGSQKHLGHRTWQKPDWPHHAGWAWASVRSHAPKAKGVGTLGLHLCYFISFSGHPKPPVMRSPISQMRPLTLRAMKEPTSAGLHSQVCAPPTWCLGPSTHLDPFNALGDDVGMVHGHQRDLDASHPAHGACPHSCRQSTDSSALLATGGGQPAGCLCRLVCHGSDSPGHAWAPTPKKGQV